MKNEIIESYTWNILKKQLQKAKISNTALYNIIDNVKEQLYSILYNFKDEDVVDKKDELVEIVKNWVDEQYNEGRVTMITDSELESVVNETATKLNQKKYLRR